MILAHELIARTAQNLAKRGIELPVFASPTIAGVTLHDTDIIYGVYRERMLDAQKKHLADVPGDDARRQGLTPVRRKPVAAGRRHGAAGQATLNSRSLAEAPSRLIRGVGGSATRGLPHVVALRTVPSGSSSPWTAPSAVVRPLWASLWRLHIHRPSRDRGVRQAGTPDLRRS